MRTLPIWKYPKMNLNDYLKQIPDYIKKPLYAQSASYKFPDRRLRIKSAGEIDRIRDSCQIASQTLKHVQKYIQTGITTRELDQIAFDFIVHKNNAYPSPLGYHGFPASICTSVNNVTVHGIPDDYQLQDGDLISIDVTVFKNGFHGDTCASYVCSNDKQSQEFNSAQRLVQLSQQCTLEAIKQIQPYQKLNSIGQYIENFCKSNKLTSLPQLFGHGIGSDFHELPYVSHFDNKDCNEIMQPGMIFTVEPILSEGQSSEIEVWEEDGWTISTVDLSRTAQCEHTILITDDSYEILTL